jgi:hypothetical protein
MCIRDRVISAETEEEKEEEQMPAGPPPQTTAEAQKYAAQMQKAMAKMVAQAQGKYYHKPIAAQALFNFDVKRGETKVRTGTTFDTIEDLSGAPVHSYDFASDTVKLTLTCIQRNPESGSVIDQNNVETSSTSVRNFKDMVVYSTGQYTDRDRQFNKMFDKAVKKCIKWIDGKVGSQPWEGQVVDVKGGKYYINAGSNAGIQPGMRFDIVESVAIGGKGVQLGTEKEKRGTLEITEVKERYSTANIISGSAQKGSIIIPST